MNKLQWEAHIKQMIADVNEDMKRVFHSGIKPLDVGSGAYIETDQENIDGCLHEDAKLLNGFDICVGYDWCSDDLDKSENRIFMMIFSDFFDKLSAVSETVADADGSGNRLWYGLIALRHKIRK